MKDKLEEEVLARQSLGFRLVKLELMLLEWEHFKVEHWNPTQAVILHLLSNCNNCQLLQPPLVGSPSSSYYEADDEGDGIPVPLPSAQSRRPLTPFPSSTPLLPIVPIIPLPLHNSLTGSRLVSR